MFKQPLSSLFRCALVAAFLLCAQPCHAQLTLYVDDDAPAGGDGTSWSTALVHLQDAMTLAGAAGSTVRDIRVAQGVYRPDRSTLNPMGSGDRNSTFALRTGLALRGGYRGLDRGGRSAGSPGNPDDRDFNTYESILSGDLAGNDGPVGAFLGTDENAYQVVVAVDAETGCLLEGFTIRGGRADGVSLGPTPASRDQGSAVNIYFGGPEIRNCIFEQNWAANHGTINDHGHDAIISDCTFRHNFSAQFGAGLYVHDHSATLAIRCVFAHNIATTDGGGAYCRSETGAVFADCRFESNQAKRGAGLYADPDSSPMVSQCLFVSNQAENGAGVYNDANVTAVLECDFDDNHASIGGAGVYNHFSDGIVDACVFTANTAAFGDPNGGGGGGGSGGAGIWNAGGSPTVSACEFIANFASFGAGVYNSDESTAEVTDCQFVDNVAAEGGGAYSLNSDVTIARCRFSGNLVEGGAFPVGGGASNYFSAVIIEQCTFERNTASLGGGGVYNEGDDSQIIRCAFHGNTSLGDTEGWGGGLLNAFAAGPTIVNCEFVGNIARRGGAIHNTVFTFATIADCTMVGNSAVGGSPGEGFGGGVFNNSDTQTTLVNCIISGNHPEQFDGTSAAETSHNCVQGGLPGIGSIDLDPQFMRNPASGSDTEWGTPDDDYGDLRLSVRSPCIDAGSNPMVPQGIVTDFAGEPRFLDVPSAPDVGQPDGANPLVDIGAYESSPIGCAADTNADGEVNVDDLLTVINQWGSTGRLSADVTGNGVVDVDDLLTVINAWGRC